MTRTRYPGIYTRTLLKGRVYDATASQGGRQKQRRGFSTLDAAKQWQDETLEDMRAGRVGRALPKLTFGEFFTERWLPGKEEDLRPKSFETYGFMSRRLVEALGSRRLTSITPLDVQDQKTAWTRAGLSGNSRRVLFALLNESLEDARKLKLIAFNPCQDISRPRAESRKPLALDRDAIRRLTETVAGSWIALEVHMALATGMRFGELAALRWEDIDFGTAVLVIPQAKTDSGIRAVAVDPRTLELLRLHRLEQMKASPKKPPVSVFLSPRGFSLNHSGFKGEWRKVIARADLAGLHFHDLRHAHATMLARAGVPLSVARSRLGHADIGITDAIYTHVTAEDQREAARLIGEALA